MKNSILLSLLICFCSVAFANNMLVQNVSTTGNNAGAQTIQVQFDISWDNSWRDAINWDAAWIFMKFKDANGLWQHCKLNQTGFTNGSGTANTVQVTADKVGSWLYRSALGSGTFNTTGMQLQWNYGLAGLTDVTGLELRVFAVEMVYVPEGEFNVAPMYAQIHTMPCVSGTNFIVNGQQYYYVGHGSFRNEIIAPGGNIPVINNRLSPTITTKKMNVAGQLVTNSQFRVKGDIGLDLNNDGIIDNTNFPIGYSSYYILKHEISEQNYCDFFNSLSSNQRNTIGLAGLNISLVNGEYFSSTPNKACGGSNGLRLLAFSDWSGLRPMSIFEFNKASYGPIKPFAGPGVNSTVNNSNPCLNYSGLGQNAGGAALYPAKGSNYPGYYISDQGNNSFETLTSLIDVGFYANASSDRATSGASYYGVLDLTGNTMEPVINLEANSSFSNTNGDGMLSLSGLADVISWPTATNVSYLDMYLYYLNTFKYGFRYVRSAE